MVLNYWSDLQAYRTDTFKEETYVRSPNTDIGLLLFGWTNDSYFNLEVVGQDGETGGEGGGGAIPTWVWITVAAGIPLAAIIIVMSRRRNEDEEA
jgi:hypothetical protein